MDESAIIAAIGIMLFSLVIYTLLAKLGSNTAVKPAVPPALPITFTSSRLLTAPAALLMSIVTIGMAAVTAGLTLDRADGIGARFGVAAACLLATVIFAWVARTYIIRAFLPDIITLSLSGVWCRVGGRIRQWSWDEIEDARLATAWRVPPIVLVLRRDDPTGKKWWRRENGREVLLGNLWKTSSLPRAPEQDIVDAIRAALAQSRAGQPITAQLSG